MLDPASEDRPDGLTVTDSVSEEVTLAERVGEGVHEIDAVTEGLVSTDGGTN